MFGDRFFHQQMNAPFQQKFSQRMMQICGNRQADRLGGLGQLLQRSERAYLEPVGYFGRARIVDVIDTGELDPFHLAVNPCVETAEVAYSHYGNLYRGHLLLRWLGPARRCCFQPC